MPSSSSPPIPKQPIGTTFLVAICILGLVALAQIIAVSMVFLRRLPPPAPSAQEPFQQPPQQSIQQAPMSMAPGGRATSAARAGIEAERLFREAQSRANVGDFDGALDLLTKADELQPDNPEILSRLAQASEKAGQREDAAAYWQRILELGPQAANFRRQAELQLSLLSTAIGTRALPAAPRGNFRPPRQCRTPAGRHPGNH